MSDDELLSGAEAALRRQNLKKALAYLEVAGARNFDDPKAHERLAHLEQRAAQPHAAKRSQLRAAQGYLRRGQVPEASTVLKQLLMVNKDCLEARLALGQIYEGKGEIEEAVIHYVEAVKILSARKDYAGAQELLDRVRQLQRVKNVLEGDTEIGSRILMTPEEPSRTVLNSERGGEDDTQPPTYQQRPNVVISPELATIGGSAEANTLIDFKFNAEDSKTLLDHRVMVQPARKLPTVQLTDATEAASNATADMPPSGPVPDVGVHQPTDIVFRELPPDVLVKFDTAVEYICRSSCRSCWARPSSAGSGS
jgi:tetratricopeptide (TPR) repeat protein